MMKNAFNFMLKALFVLEICMFLSWLFGYWEKQLDKEAKVNFETYDITDWTANNYFTHIAQYLKKEIQSGNEIWSVNKIFFFSCKNHWENETGRLVSDLFFVIQKKKEQKVRFGRL